LEYSVIKRGLDMSNPLSYYLHIIKQEYVREA
jgi:hypothetical protein